MSIYIFIFREGIEDPTLIIILNKFQRFSMAVRLRNTFNFTEIGVEFFFERQGVAHTLKHEVFRDEGRPVSSISRLIVQPHFNALRRSSTLDVDFGPLSGQLSYYNKRVLLRSYTRI